MAIKLVQGFDIKSADSIDKRITLTKAEMLAIDPNIMPDNYISICKNDGKLYIYNSVFEVSETTGKFRLYEELLDLPAAITKGIETPEGKAALEAAMSKTLPGAMKDVMNNKEAAKEMADTMFDSEQFSLNVDDKISLAIETIQAIDGMG